MLEKKDVKDPAAVRNIDLVELSENRDLLFLDSQSS